MSKLFVLFENASGFGLFEQTESDEIGQFLEEMQTAMVDLSRLSKVASAHACGQRTLVLTQRMVLPGDQAEGVPALQERRGGAFCAGLALLTLIVLRLAAAVLTTVAAE